jgi:hypothetical protein
VLKRHGFFGINILTADQVNVAERFTGRDGLKGPPGLLSPLPGMAAAPARVGRVFP